MPEARLPPRTSASADNHPRFTLIPPGPVSDKIRVEMRLAIPNPTESPRTYTVTFYRDRIAPDRRIETQTVTAPPGGFALSRAWWDTTGHAGKRVLRWRVESDAGSREGSRPLEVIPCETQALPWLQAGWTDPLALSRDTYPRDRDLDARDVRDRIDAMRRLGMTVVIVTYVEYFGHFFYPSKVEFFDRDVQRIARGQKFGFDVVETILSRADRNGMHVFLGLGRGGDTKLLWEFDRPDWTERNAEALRIGKRVAAELWERYGHHPSFYGWYLTHEMNDLARASAYYNPIAAYLHSLSPEKPVMVAPAGTPILDRESLRNSGVEIFAYQDAVGAGYVPYRNTFQPEQRIAMLEEIFRVYRRAHEGTGKHLWADLEIWEMDGSRGYSGAYPASFARVKRQIERLAPQVEMLTAYEIFGFLEPPRSRNPLKDGRAARLFEEYEAYLKQPGSAKHTRGDG